MAIKIFVISLEDCLDRQEFMKEQLKDLDFSFFSAIDLRKKESIDLLDSSLKKRITPFKNKLYWGRELRSAEIGCFLSHFSLWPKCIELDSSIVVLEDDVKLESNFLEAIKQIEASKYEYVRLYETKKNYRQKNLESNFFITYDYVSGTLGYFITPNAAKKFIKHAKSILMPVDDYMDCFFTHFVPNVVYLPLPISTTDLDSTIQGNKTKIDYKFSREVVRTYRSIKKFIVKHLFFRFKF